MTVSRLPTPDFATSSPGPGREVRGGIGWTPLKNTIGSGLQLEIGSRKDRTTLRGRSSRFLRVGVHTRMGKAQLSGHNLGERCWSHL